jgi:hypothetical protein
VAACRRQPSRSKLASSADPPFNRKYPFQASPAASAPGFFGSFVSGHRCCNSVVFRIPGLTPNATHFSSPKRQRGSQHALKQEELPRLRVGLPSQSTDVSAIALPRWARLESVSRSTTTTILTNAEIMTALTAQLGHPKILVLGDAMLDRYTWGIADRVSPEAPVLVLRTDEREVRLGGAASVAVLLRALEAEVTLAAVVGDDHDGRTIGRLLDEAAIEARPILIDPSRPTTTKERSLADPSIGSRIKCFVSIQNRATRLMTI